MHILCHLYAHTDVPNNPPQTKTHSSAFEDTLLGQRRRFHEASRATSQIQTNSHIYEMQLFSCSMILSLSPLPFLTAATMEGNRGQRCGHAWSILECSPPCKRKASSDCCLYAEPSVCHTLQCRTLRTGRILSAETAWLPFPA